MGKILEKTLMCSTKGNSSNLYMKHSFDNFLSASPFKRLLGSPLASSYVYFYIRVASLFCKLQAKLTILMQNGLLSWQESVARRVCARCKATTARKQQFPRTTNLPDCIVWRGPCFLRDDEHCPTSLVVTVQGLLV